MIIELLREFLLDLRAHRTRALLTLVAITWGTVAVVLLLSFGNGLGHQLMNGLRNAGDRILVVWGGETGVVFEGLPKGRRIRMTEEDVQTLERAIPDIDLASPQYRNNVTLTYGKFSITTECEGVNPGFEEMRRMYPTAGGRFLTDLDVTLRRRVIFLGSEIAKEIFGQENPVGKVLNVDGIPFTVVGIMQKKLQTSMSNGPDTRRAVMPYTAFRTMYGMKYVNNIVVRPASAEKQALVKSEIYRVLGRKYRFDPGDERALGIWDFIAAEKMSQKIDFGMSIFLGSVGFLTLLIAGVGVANVMYVVVKERTREIGIRLAIGAKRRHIMAQFMFEALLLAFVGGGVGLLFSWSVVSLAQLLPHDSMALQMLGSPVLSLPIMLLTVLILGSIGLAAGYFPARRASSVDPVDSLRYE